MKDRKLSHTHNIFPYLILFSACLIFSLVLTFYEYQTHPSSIKLINISFMVVALFLSGLSMFLWIKDQKVEQELHATLEAIARSQAIIEFEMDGTIISANKKFLDALGYTLEEIQGKHHSIFVDKEYSMSEDYRNFWAKLNRGEYEQAEFKRFGKNNKEVWLLSSYNPILNTKGKPIKVIKVATDITEQKNQRSYSEMITNNLKEMSNKIIKESNEISVGVNQLEFTVSDQVTSASQQAAAVTQISSTIEEIKITTNQTRGKAKQLGESASLTSKEGEKGREAIASMTESIKLLQEKMQQISTTILSLNDKTQQISEITEAVADIAKQSKMLALNASIEAAKAGESGKGFAVVAGEVKDLAERSQQLTERVQKILQDIRQTAEHAVMVTDEGTKSAEKNSQQIKLTGEIINSLGNVIEGTTQASMQIVSAIREEAVAIDQIDLSIKEINKVTNVFSSATEQTKKATMSLSQVAESLKNTVSQYDVRE